MSEDPDAVLEWNRDKPHRCPACHAITLPTAPSPWRVYTCCTCAAWFSGFPRLARILPKVGVTCVDHRHSWRTHRA